MGIQGWNSVCSRACKRNGLLPPILKYIYVQLQVTQVICFAILDDEQSKLEGSGSGLDSYLPELVKVTSS